MLISKLNSTISLNIRAIIKFEYLEISKLVNKNYNNLFKIKVY